MNIFSNSGEISRVLAGLVPKGLDPSLAVNEVSSNCCSSGISKRIAVNRISADPTEPGVAHQRSNTTRRGSVKGKDEHV